MAPMFWSADSMLAFDIETTGLNPRQSTVTVVCAESFATGQRKAYEFARLRQQIKDSKLSAGEGAAKIQELVDELVADFDAAESLCAFNGVRFDLPFLRTSLGIADMTVARWVLKTTDILEQSRLHYRTTFSLNLLCEANGIAQKTGDGLHAIKMAADGDFDGLRDYCEDDVHILCNLYKKRHITLPKLGQDQDLAMWAHPALYPDSVTPDATEQHDKSGGEECPVGGACTAGSTVRELIDDLFVHVSGVIEPSGLDLLQAGEGETGDAGLRTFARRVLEKLDRIKQKLP